MKVFPSARRLDGFLHAVYVFLPTGQVSWHYPDRDTHFFAHVPEVAANPWDGHTSAEKYDRLNALPLLTTD